jgi:secreted PhoX family phosphatase
MLDRRRFLLSIAAAALPNARARAGDGPLGPLRRDPNRLLDLPEGFELTVVSRAGERMDDGLQVPAAHDGMAAFEGDDGRIILVCNHEMNSGYPEYSAFGTTFADFPAPEKEKVYDWGNSETPGAGGTTTVIYNPATRETERRYLSLGGTEINCAGGPTPWGSWLSCEECFESPGTSYGTGRKIVREERHGYVFEVPSRAEGLVDAYPLRAMGRFEHEACAVDPRTGIVYMTEDRHHSLFYRFIPAVPGRLREGGRLQALMIIDSPSLPTHNWARRTVVRDEPLPVAWLDLDDVDPVENDLRLRGANAGAATFARGEGLCAAAGDFAFTCTIGGPERLGQVFSYTPSPYEGTQRERETPGALTLIAEATADSLLKNADNITMAPWGDLIVCEDTNSHCGLIGIRPDGSQYEFADNAYSDSELAGVCFSPDGRTLFVNIQYPGMTVAINGPWPS